MTEDKGVPKNEGEATTLIVIASFLIASLSSLIVIAAIVDPAIVTLSIATASIVETL